MLRRNICIYLRKRRAELLSQRAQILAGASRSAEIRSFKGIFRGELLACPRRCAGAGARQRDRQ
jgi:hypothetical protein